MYEVLEWYDIRDVFRRGYVARECVGTLYDLSESDL